MNRNNAIKAVIGYLIGVLIYIVVKYLLKLY